MSRSASKRRWIAAGAAALVAALLCVPVQAVTVRPARGSGLLWAAPAGAGTEVKLTWTHTVSRRPVSERYMVAADGRIHLQEMVFDHFGPNLPAAPEEGTSWQFTGDKVVVTGYQVALDQLLLGVAPFGHQLKVGGLEWDLLAGAGPDRAVRVTVEWEPLLLIILTEVWQWRNSISRS